MLSIASSRRILIISRDFRRRLETETTRLDLERLVDLTAATLGSKYQNDKMIGRRTGKKTEGK